MNHLSTDPRQQWITDQLKQALEPSTLEVINDGWKHQGHAEEGAGHFTIRIASNKFNGLTLLECHRLVYDALEGAVGRTIHAVQIDIQR